MIEILTKPRRELSVTLPVRMDNGSSQEFTGYRVQHNNARGPFKGGLRYHPQVSLNEIQSIIDVDDVEVCNGGDTLWWCKGWDHL